MRRTRMSRRASSILQIRRESPTRYFQNSPRAEPLRAWAMGRGVSEGARRSWRNFRMRLRCCGSRELSSRAAVAANSIVEAMLFQETSQWNGAFFAGADPFESLLGEVEVFQVSKMLEDGFADVEGLGATGA